MIPLTRTIGTIDASIVTVIMRLVRVRYSGLTICSGLTIGNGLKHIHI
jgi:hypothetical protein